MSELAKDIDPFWASSEADDHANVLLCAHDIVPGEVVFEENGVDISGDMGVDQGQSAWSKPQLAGGQRGGIENVNKQCDLYFDADVDNSGGLEPKVDHGMLRSGEAGGEEDWLNNRLNENIVTDLFTEAVKKSAVATPAAAATTAAMTTVTNILATQDEEPEEELRDLAQKSTSLFEGMQQVVVIPMTSVPVQAVIDHCTDNAAAAQALKAQKDLKDKDVRREVMDTDGEQLVSEESSDNTTTTVTQESVRFDDPIILKQTKQPQVELSSMAQRQINILTVDTSPLSHHKLETPEEEGKEESPKHVEARPDGVERPIFVSDDELFFSPSDADISGMNVMGGQPSDDENSQARSPESLDASSLGEDDNLHLDGSIILGCCKDNDGEAVSPASFFDNSEPPREVSIPAPNSLSSTKSSQMVESKRLGDPAPVPTSSRPDAVERPMMVVSESVFPQRNILPVFGGIPDEADLLDSDSELENIGSPPRSSVVKRSSSPTRVKKKSPKKTSAQEPIFDISSPLSLLSLSREKVLLSKAKRASKQSSKQQRKKESSSSPKSSKLVSPISLYSGKSSSEQLKQKQAAQFQQQKVVLENKLRHQQMLLEQQMLRDAQLLEHEHQKKRLRQEALLLEEEYRQKRKQQLQCFSKVNVRTSPRPYRAPTYKQPKRVKKKKSPPKKGTKRRCHWSDRR